MEFVRSLFVSSLFLVAPVETQKPITEQSPSKDGNAQKPTSTTASLFGGFTGTSFADFVKSSSPANSTRNSKSEPFSSALTQNSSNGGLDQKSSTPASVFGASSGMSFADLAKNTNSTAADSSTANEPFGFAALAQNSSNGGTTPAFGQSSGPVNGTARNDANAGDAKRGQATSSPFSFGNGEFHCLFCFVFQ